MADEIDQSRSHSPTFNSSRRRRKRKGKRASINLSQEQSDRAADGHSQPKRLPPNSSQQQSPALLAEDDNFSSNPLIVSAVFARCEIVSQHPQLLAAITSDLAATSGHPLHDKANLWSEFSTVLSALQQPSEQHLKQAIAAQLQYKTEQIPLLQWPYRAVELLSSLSCQFQQTLDTASQPRNTTVVSNSSVLDSSISATSTLLHQQLHSLHVYLRVYLASVCASKQQQALDKLLPPLSAFVEALPITALTSLLPPQRSLVLDLLYDTILHMAAVAVAVTDLHGSVQAQSLCVCLLRALTTIALTGLEDSVERPDSAYTPFSIAFYWLQRTLVYITSQQRAQELWFDLVLHLVTTIARQYAINPAKLSIVPGEPLKPRHVLYRVLELDTTWIQELEEDRCLRTDVLTAALQCWQWTERKEQPPLMREICRWYQKSPVTKAGLRSLWAQCDQALWIQSPSLTWPEWCQYPSSLALVHPWQPPFEAVCSLIANAGEEGAAFRALILPRLRPPLTTIHDRVVTDAKSLNSSAHALFNYYILLLALCQCGYQVVKDGKATKSLARWLVGDEQRFQASIEFEASLPIAQQLLVQALFRLLACQASHERDGTATSQQLLDLYRRAQQLESNTKQAFLQAKRVGQADHVTSSLESQWKQAQGVLETWQSEAQQLLRAIFDHTASSDLACRRRNVYLASRLGLFRLLPSDKQDFEWTAVTASNGVFVKQLLFPLLVLVLLQRVFRLEAEASDPDWMNKNHQQAMLHLQHQLLPKLLQLLEDIRDSASRELRAALHKCVLLTLTVLQGTPNFRWQQTLKLDQGSRDVLNSDHPFLRLLPLRMVQLGNITGLLKPTSDCHRFHFACLLEYEARPLDVALAFWQLLPEDQHSNQHEWLALAKEHFEALAQHKADGNMHEYARLLWPTGSLPKAPSAIRTQYRLRVQAIRLVLESALSRAIDPDSRLINQFQRSERFRPRMYYSSQQEQVSQLLSGFKAVALHSHKHLDPTRQELQLKLVVQVAAQLIELAGPVLYRQRSANLYTWIADSYLLRAGKVDARSRLHLARAFVQSIGDLGLPDDHYLVRVLRQGCFGLALGTIACPNCSPFAQSLEDPLLMFAASLFKPLIATDASGSRTWTRHFVLVRVLPDFFLARTDLPQINRLVVTGATFLSTLFAYHYRQSRRAKELVLETLAKLEPQPEGMSSIFQEWTLASHDPDNEVHQLAFWHSKLLASIPMLIDDLQLAAATVFATLRKGRVSELAVHPLHALRVGFQCVTSAREQSAEVGSRLEAAGLPQPAPLNPIAKWYRGFGVSLINEALNQLYRVRGYRQAKVPDTWKKFSEHVPEAEHIKRFKQGDVIEAGCTCPATPQAPSGSIEVECLHIFEDLLTLEVVDQAVLQGTISHLQELQPQGNEDGLKERYAKLVERITKDTSST
eukprot:m.132945 g.132945  ORF g.132945 m.132945 type:complete len:1425 (+) comp15936_c0_seq1:62-4336(+)